MSESPFAARPVPAPELPEEPPVLRLHPLSLVLRFIKLLPQLIYIVPALYVGGTRFMGPILLGVLGIGMLVAWLTWYRFSYQIGAEEMRISSGVLNRNTRSIPYERIQDVNVEQKLLARLLGLAAVKLETGSAGNGNDGELNAVSLAEAERLRDVIRRRKAGLADQPAASVDSEAAVAVQEAAPIFAMDNRRIFIAGLFNFSLVIFALLGAVFQNADFLVPDDFYTSDFWLTRVDSGKSFAQIGIMAQIIGALAALAGLIFIGMATGIIRTFFREYGFRLDRTENGFRRRRGLTTLTDMAMPLHRIQAASIITGPIKKRWDWHILKFQSLASDGKNESDHAVAPLAHPHEIDRIMAEPGIVRETAAPFAPVTKAYWGVPAAGFAVLLALVSAALAIFADLRLLGLLVLIVPITAILWLRWRHHTYVLANGQLFVREGFWQQKLTILPVRKVQSVDIAQSFLGRAFGHASVVIGVAGGSGLLPLTVHDMAEEQSRQLRAQLLAPIL